MTKSQPAGTEGVTIDYAAIVASWSPEERAEREKKFLKKIDYRLLPILVSTWSLNHTFESFGSKS